MTTLLIAYLAFSFSAWLAVVKFFVNPHMEKNLYDSGYHSESGFDLSWCECTAMVALALTPGFNVAMNLFWFWVLRQHIDRRPLIKWPSFKMPKCKLPKCPIAIRGTRVSGDEN